jgi:hypothetical protein
MPLKMIIISRFRDKQPIKNKKINFWLTPNLFFKRLLKLLIRNQKKNTTNLFHLLNSLILAQTRRKINLKGLYLILNQ